MAGKPCRNGSILKGLLSSRGEVNQTKTQKKRGKKLENRITDFLWDFAS